MIPGRVVPRPIWGTVVASSVVSGVDWLLMDDTSISHWLTIPDKPRMTSGDLNLIARSLGLQTLDCYTGTPPAKT
jgi:hypothetical protein